MQLTYRGVSYEYQPPVVEMKSTSEVGTYRGVEMGFRTINPHTCPPQPTDELVYRGVAYRTGSIDATSKHAVGPEILPAAAEQERDFSQITTA